MNIPDILINPKNPIYQLDETEIYYIKEIYELVEIEHYYYSIFAIWNCIINNLQRRIEIFGIEVFLNSIENKNTYNSEAKTLKDRWLNVNDHTLIKNAQTINIISPSTKNIITAIYWMKTNNTEENKDISKEEIYSLLHLLERKLFLKEFKVDKRKSTSPNDKIRNNRRKEDRISTNQELSTTHQKLLLKYGMQAFQEEEKKDNLFNEYG